MKLSFTAAVAAAAFSTHASAFKVVVDSDNNYCIMQVKYSGASGTLWTVDSTTGAITSTGAPADVKTDGNGNPTIAQNGVNDPTDEILAEVRAQATVIVYDPDSGNALAAQPTLTNAEILALDWCQSYSTFAPEHYCKADGNWVGEGQKLSLGGTLQACCESKHPDSVYNSCVEKATGIVSSIIFTSHHVMFTLNTRLHSHSPPSPLLSLFTGVHG